VDEAKSAAAKLTAEQEAKKVPTNRMFLMGDLWRMMMDYGI
jgi:hypothetical protein